MDLTNEDTPTTASATQSIVTNMNYWSIPFINKLPAEVLALIMQIVVSYAPCYKKAKFTQKKSPAPRYPEALTHVCSHWRQVALRSCSLWSHIDIPTLGAPGHRAMIFLTRAGQAPLSLHLSDDHWNRGALATSFFASTKLRLKSIELVVPSGAWGHACAPTLSTCLATCMTADLTELVIHKIYPYAPPTRPGRPIFIKARSHPAEISPPDTVEPAYMDLELPNERLEDVLRSVTFLWLDQVYPQWTSSAYHGLVELRLLGRLEADTSIPESQLIKILGSSPRLRVLHFDLNIVNVAPFDTTVDNPIVLSDLEVINFNFNWMQGGEVGIFFRWLAPAPKLFQLSLRPSNFSMDFRHPTTAAFLSGSNITMIHTNQLYPEEVAILVGHCRHVRVLALEKTDLACTGEGLDCRVDTLYLINCIYLAGTLHQLLKAFSVQRLVVYETGSRSGRFTLLFPGQVPVSLSELCSDIVILPDDALNPVEGWEAFWYK